MVWKLANLFFYSSLLDIHCFFFQVFVTTNQLHKYLSTYGLTSWLFCIYVIDPWIWDQKGDILKLSSVTRLVYKGIIVYLSFNN